jgi:hypothetical protein
MVHPIVPRQARHTLCGINRTWPSLDQCHTLVASLDQCHTLRGVDCSWPSLDQCVQVADLEWWIIIKFTLATVDVP